MDETAKKLTQSDFSRIMDSLKNLSTGDQSTLRAALNDTPETDTPALVTTSAGSANDELWSFFVSFGWMMIVPAPQDILDLGLNIKIFELTADGKINLAALVNFAENKSLNSTNVQDDPDLYPPDINEFSVDELSEAVGELKTKYPDAWNYFHQYGIVKVGAQDEKDKAWSDICSVVTKLPRVRFNAHNIAHLIRAIATNIYKG